MATTEEQNQTAPITPPVSTPEAKPKKRYEYQMTDDQGRPFGGKQVVEYENEQELADKLAKAHTEAMKLNHRLKRDRFMGAPETDEEKLPEDVERIDERAYSFQPRELTAEEQFEINQNPSSPRARRLLIESELGASPEAIRGTLRKATEDISAIRAKEEARAFASANPDYYACPENFQVLAQWMIQKNLEPTKKNFQLSYERAKKAELLFESPVVASETSAETQPEEVEDTRISDSETSQPKRPVKTSSGLNRTNSSVGGGGSASRSKGYSKAEIAAMSSEEYRQKVLLPEIRKAQSQRSRGN